MNLLPVTRLARFELARFRGLLPRLALVFVVCVPLLYGAVYLSANWDPYGKVDRLPVALVNEDVGTTYEDQEVRAGDDLVSSLQEQDTFAYEVTDAGAAARGLSDGDYFMTVTIPRTFSADLVSGAGDEPRRAEVQLRRDDANGFVVGSITARAEDAIELGVDASAIDSYFGAVFDNLGTIRDGMSDAADGAAQLETGLADAEDGAGQLVDGADQAGSGATSLSEGAAELASGATGASAGATSLDEGLGELESGAGDLAKGADQVSDGTQQLSDQVLPALATLDEALPTVEQHASDIGDAAVRVTGAGAETSAAVSASAQEVQAELAAIQQAHPELADDPSWQELSGHVDGLTEDAVAVEDAGSDIAGLAAEIDEVLTGDSGLQDRVEQAESDLTRLNDGAHQVADGASDLEAGIALARAGSTDLAAGLDDLTTGAGQLSTGASDLAAGVGELGDGLGDLDDGLIQLHDGATDLSEGLADGVSRIPVLTDDEEDQAAQVLSSPADVSSSVDHPATYYGRGLAPMFFAIALWVFGISVFMVVRPISGRLLAGRAHPVRLALTAWLPVASLAVVGGLLMIAVVWLGLGLDPVHGTWLVGLTVLGALCFSAIAHVLRTALGTVATAVILVWLIVQLPSSGGTFPAELLPGIFGGIAPLMPMTYLIDGFRVVVSGGQVDHLVRDAVVLLGMTLAAVLLCAVVVARRQQFRVKDLHPPLQAP